MIDLKILPSEENLNPHETTKTTFILRQKRNPKTSIRCIDENQQKLRSFTRGSQLLQVTQRQSAIQSQKQLQDVKNIMLTMKVRSITDIFIRKLMRNHHSKEIKPVKIKRIEHICKLKGIQFSQRLEHFVIAAFVLSIVILLILTSFEATLIQFSNKVQGSVGVIIVKVICLFFMLSHAFIHALGHRFKNGQYLQYASEILQTYLKSPNALIDLTTILLLILFLIYPKNRWLSIVYFCFLIFDFMRSVSELVNLEAAYIHSRKISMIWRLFKIVIFNLILAHIVATILLGISYLDPETSWIVKYGIQGASWYVYYITAYYWGTIMVTTIGFGDISCGNWRQATVVSIIVMFTSIILGFNLSQFNNIFANLRASTEKISQNKAIFKRMIIRDENNNATIDPSLKKQIYKFIDDEGLDKGDIQFAERNQFISSLPQYLRKAYLRAANKKIFVQVLFFNQLKHQTISLICNSFSNYFLYPEEQILDPNNKINILEEGKVGFIYKRDGSTINGMIFDEMNVSKKQNLLLLNSDFLTMHKETNYGFYGKSCSIIWSLGIEEFVDILRTDCMDFEYYFSILHKHSFDDDQWQVKKCSRCSTSQRTIKHSTFKCPQISYMPMRNLITYRYIKDSQIHNQFRSHFPRTRRQNVSVLKYYKNYFETLVQEKAKLESDQRYLANFFPKRNPANVRNLELISEEMQAKYYDQHSSTLIIDNPQNFDYYFPTYNPSKFSAYPLDKNAQKHIVQITTMSKLHPYSFI